MLNPLLLTLIFYTKFCLLQIRLFFNKRYKKLKGADVCPVTF